jgi:hypothetical protein
MVLELFGMSCVPLLLIYLERNVRQTSEDRELHRDTWDMAKT